jgi:hypothetical protein
MEATVTDLGSLTILNDLRDRIAALIPEDTAGFERRMMKPAPAGTTNVGVVTNPVLRGLQVLSVKLISESGLESSRALCEPNADLEREAKERAAMLMTLGTIYKEIFWAQIKQDFAIYRHADITLCEGWTVYEKPCGSGAPSGIIELFLGGLPK